MTQALKTRRLSINDEIVNTMAHKFLSYQLTVDKSQNNQKKVTGDNIVMCKWNGFKILNQLIVG
jgi:hypothetical protein